MEFETTTQDDVTVVSISGSIDALTAESVLNALLEPITSGETRLVTDLSGVDYTSSAGLRVILAAQKEIRQKGGDLRLAGAQPMVQRQLELTRFTSIIKIYDDAGTAVASFGAA